MTIYTPPRFWSSVLEMRKTISGIGLLAAMAVVLWGQRERVVPETTPLEVRSVFPHEVTPGQYQQVSQNELQLLASDGWELVSVMPYVYRNEEHGAELQARAVVTQTYPAYFFKRVRASGRR
jgi:hypothetical protein